MQNTRVSDIGPFFDGSTYSCEHECGKVCVWRGGGGGSKDESKAVRKRIVGGVGGGGV